MDQSQESGELLRDKMHACAPWNFQELARTDKLKIALRQIYTRQIILQKRIIQIITKSQYDAHAPPIFYKLKLLALKQIHNLQAGLFMFSAHKKLLSEKFQDMLQKKLTNTILIKPGKQTIIEFPISELISENLP